MCIRDSIYSLLYREMTWMSCQRGRGTSVGLGHQRMVLSRRYMEATAVVALSGISVGILFVSANKLTNSSCRRRVDLDTHYRVVYVERLSLQVWCSHGHSDPPWGLFWGLSLRLSHVKFFILVIRSAVCVAKASLMVCWISWTQTNDCEITEYSI